jgi:hypothetical protein
MTQIDVVPGESAARTVAEALGPSRQVVPLVDCLTLGPLHPLEDLPEWTSRRRSFWRHIYPAQELSDEVISPTSVLADAESITVWLGTGPNDQLALAWLLMVLDKLGRGPAAVGVIQFPDWVFTRTRTPSLALLNSGQLKSHADPVLLTDTELDVLRQAWAAATSPNPDLLTTFLSRKDGCLPVLRSALSQLIWRYPDSGSGLSRWDFRLLANIREHGPRAIMALGHTLSAPGWDDDPVGDGWLFWRARRFASESLAHPLVKLFGSLSDYREATVEVTPAGHAVLAGSANAFDLNGVDDWVGGVHLSSEQGRVWVRENENLVRRSV